MTPNDGFTEDPSSLLEETFRRIHRERMADHPFVNPALDVEPVGFRIVEGHWIGALITPWFINLIALPGPGEDWEPHVEGGTRSWTFPGGTHTFRSDREDGLGDYLSCPILPSVVHLPDQDHARRVAEALLRLLFSPPKELPPSPPPAPDGEEPGEAEDRPSSMAGLVTRRSFLRGAFFRD